MIKFTSFESKTECILGIRCLIHNLCILVHNFLALHECIVLFGDQILIIGGFAPWIRPWLVRWRLASLGATCGLIAVVHEIVQHLFAWWKALNCVGKPWCGRKTGLLSPSSFIKHFLIDSHLLMLHIVEVACTFRVLQILILLETLSLAVIRLSLVPTSPLILELKHFLLLCDQWWASTGSFIIKYAERRFRLWFASFRCWGFCLWRFLDKQFLHVDL